MARLLGEKRHVLAIQDPVSGSEHFFPAHKVKDPSGQAHRREVGSKEGLDQAAVVGQSSAMTSRMASLEKGLARKRSTI